MKWLIGSIIVILFIIFGVQLGGSNEPKNPSQEPEGTQYGTAPRFSLEDYNGNIISLSDSDGKIRIINAWATWCPFCVNELPDFAVLQEQFPDIEVIAINRREASNDAKAFTDDLDLSDAFTFLLDPSDSFYQSIGGFAMPETLFVDEEGFIRVHKRGFMTLEEMVMHVESIINN